MKMVHINENKKKFDRENCKINIQYKVNNRERIHLTDLKFCPHTVYNNEQIQ